MNVFDEFEPESEALVTYIFPDFNAVWYIQRDFIHQNEFCMVEETTANGFDIYLVEQWVVNRKVGTIVSTYTGNTNTDISVVKFTVADKPLKDYPPRFQEYLNELKLNHAKAKQLDETFKCPKGLLFVTNLSALPSALHLIPIHSGDLRDIENDFIVNSNLKRMQCGGRSYALVSNKIPDACENKFRQLYRIYNTSVPIKFAVLELVNIIQTCLFYFELLDVKYCDGLLCSKTEEALANWWNLIGMPHFKKKPDSDALNDKTVAAIISLILSIRLRLQILGCDVPKDPCDFENFMLSIGQAQKQFKLEKKRKLDLQTVLMILTVTNAKLLPDKYQRDALETEENMEYLNHGGDVGVPSQNLYLPTPKYKRKKHYSKEIKKITNVVKNTVQDRIITPTKDLDGISIPGAKSSGRIRNTIAKLTDTANPLAVETMDLDYLVKRHLSGKTFIRLWYGIQDNTGSSENRNSISKNNELLNHTKHHKRPPFYSMVSNSDKTKSYRFVSLKDAIGKTQMLLYKNDDISRYSKGINRVKIGLQNSRLLLSNTQNRKTDAALHVKHRRPEERLVDSDNINDIDKSFNRRYCMAPNENGFNEILRDMPFSFPTFCENKFKRRHSFPFCDQLKTIINEDAYCNSRKDSSVDDKLVLRKVCSFSQVEDYYATKSVQFLYSLGNLISNYSRTYRHISELLNLRRQITSNNEKIKNGKVGDLHDKLNRDLNSFMIIYDQMLSNKQRIMNEELPQILDYHIKELSASIDRLFYECRIVLKRINELDDNAKDFEKKLKKENVDKIDSIVNNLIYLGRFIDTFSEPDERNEIVTKLTGKSVDELNYNRNIQNLSQSTDIIKYFVLFMYDLMIFILQIFKFDRNRMNLDRIKRSWKKIDPNKKYINKIYSQIGKKPERPI